MEMHPAPFPPFPPFPRKRRTAPGIHVFSTAATLGEAMGGRVKPGQGIFLGCAATCLQNRMRFPGEALREKREDTQADSAVGFWARFRFSGGRPIRAVRGIAKATSGSGSRAR
jgi:hypothetical protein